MKFVVIEDHALMRDLLIRVCHEQFEGAVAEGARDAASGLRLCRRAKPDIVILDLALPDRDGLDLVDEILAEAPRSRIIALSGFMDEYTIHRILGSRVHGFVDKTEHSPEQLASAIRHVLAGERYFSPAAKRSWQAFRNDPTAFDKILSKREQSLLRLFGQGQSNETIAAATNLSELTVRNHRCRIMAKLGLRTSAELISYAFDKGFVRSKRQSAAN
ncbi:MAG TPA: response regulator transcription factor [Lacunisphaera sp.]|jgi:DNA-binding NarL/FixJ family response regulator|nr:response regulator transcription factor [Lacunisphaera sp.]